MTQWKASEWPYATWIGYGLAKRFGDRAMVLAENNLRPAFWVQLNRICQTPSFDKRWP